MRKAHACIVTMNDEHFVYLFSSLNKLEYPRNSPWGFTNKISPSLNLDENYEVGLVNLAFTNNLVSIKKGDRKYQIVITIRDKDKKTGKKQKCDAEEYLNNNNLGL